jgi:cytochrome c-type biogenesis protein CcmH
MAEGFFWVGALGLALGVVAVLVLALRRASVPAPGTADPDLVIYKDQMAEIARDLARGTINADEAERLRAEVGRRVLEADRSRSAGGTIGAAGTGRRSRLLALGLVAATVPATAALYGRIGAPGYPDLPLEARIAALDAAIAARPGQEAELARLQDPRDPAADEAAQQAVAGLTAPEALRSAFQTRFQAGEMLAAIRAQERLLAVLGDQATAADHANLALALVAEARGYVSPEAEAELRAALKLDLTNELARYLVGEMFLQGGRFDQTFRFWRPLLEDGPPDAPWVGPIAERIQTVADLAGIPYEAPAAGGPTGEDMAAAAEMSPEDRQAMIEGMVAQLSERLAAEGGDVEDWERLIRSLAVLERLPEAQTIYDEAKLRFEGRPAELSFLRMAAVESGLSP